MKFITISILFYIIAAVPLFFARPVRAEPTTRAWRLQVESDLGKVEKDIVKLSSSDKLMAQIGMPRTVDGDSRLLWLARLSKDNVLAYGLFIQCQDAVYSDLIAIWFDSTNPGLIPELNQQEVMERTDDIIHFYRDWLRTAPESREVILMQTLPKNIAALNSIYCWNALLVLQNTIDFSGSINVSHPYTFHQVKPQFRDECYKRFKGWFDAYDGGLKWDDLNQQFTSADGLPFPLPNFNIKELMGISPEIQNH
ncbi:MAG: hypothetical protein M3O30_18230 [Planctomycetota bacterium]|nr:hypothetical protein [Planctomycetota bacterium]